MGPVTPIVGAKGVPLVALLAHGEAVETLLPTTLAAGVTVICELMATFGLACPLCGVNVAVTVLSMAGTGVAGA